MRPDLESRPAGPATDDVRARLARIEQVVRDLILMQSEGSRHRLTGHVRADIAAAGQRLADYLDAPRHDEWEVR
jgi:hypothetical protein